MNFVFIDIEVIEWDIGIIVGVLIGRGFKVDVLISFFLVIYVLLYCVCIIRVK